MGGKADAPLRGAKPKLLAHRSAEPRAGLLMPRPHAFVEAAEDHEIGLLQPRFERPPDEEPRMQRRAWSHHLAGNEPAIEGRIVRGGERETMSCIVSSASRTDSASPASSCHRAEDEPLASRASLSATAAWASAKRAAGLGKSPLALSVSGAKAASRSATSLSAA